MNYCTYGEYARSIGLELDSLTLGKRRTVHGQIMNVNRQTLFLRGTRLRFLAEPGAIPSASFNIQKRKMTNFNDYSKMAKGEQYASVWDKMREDSAHTVQTRFAEGTGMFLYKGSKDEESHLALTSHDDGNIVLIPLGKKETITIAKTRFLAVDDSVEGMKVKFNNNPNIIIHSKTDGVFTEVTGGNVFVEAAGDCNVYELKEGEELHVWPGHLVAYTSSAKIEMVKTSDDPLVLERGYFEIRIVATESKTIVYVQTGTVENPANKKN